MACPFSRGRPLVGQLPSVVGPPKKHRGKYLNMRTRPRRKYAFREGMCLVAHCGFTMHEPSLYSSRKNAALYNIVILELCACLFFPYRQQLEKMAKWVWGRGNGDAERIQAPEWTAYNFLDNEALDTVICHWCQSVGTAFFLPNPEVRVDINQDCENKADEAQDFFTLISASSIFGPSPHGVPVFFLQVQTCHRLGCFY